MTSDENCAASNQDMPVHGSDKYEWCDRDTIERMMGMEGQ